MLVFACDRSDKSEQSVAPPQPPPQETPITQLIESSGSPVLPRQSPTDPHGQDARQTVEKWKEQIWEKRGNSFYAVLCTSEKPLIPDVDIPNDVTPFNPNRPFTPKIHDFSRKEKTVTNRYVIEAKDLRLEIHEDPLTEADQLNGLQWKGNFQHFAKVSRYKACEDKVPDEKDWYQGRWSEWVSGLWNPEIQNYALNPVYEMEKRNGEWRISLFADIGAAFGKTRYYEKAKLPKE